MADVASREGLIQVMRDMLAAPEEFDWLATRLEIARKLRNDPVFHQGWAERSAELSAATSERLRRQKQAGRYATTCPARCCRPIWISCSTGWWRGWPPATTRPSSARSSIWSRIRCANRIDACANQPTRRVRWLGPPRLRIVVPDSRSIEWMDP